MHKQHWHKRLSYDVMHVWLCVRSNMEGAAAIAFRTAGPTAAAAAAASLQASFPKQGRAIIQQPAAAQPPARCSAAQRGTRHSSICIYQAWQCPADDGQLRA
jgi:hypothetical protein